MQTDCIASNCGYWLVDKSALWALDSTYVLINSILKNMEQSQLQNIETRELI
jgi:hypothetical protein